MAYTSQPLMPKEAIADSCGMSRAVVYRIIRSYKNQCRHRSYKHLNSIEGREYKAQRASNARYNELNQI